MRLDSLQAQLQLLNLSLLITSRARRLARRLARVRFTPPTRLQSDVQPCLVPVSAVEPTQRRRRRRCVSKLALLYSRPLLTYRTTDEA